MTSIEMKSRPVASPAWLWVAGLLGLAWNLFGLVQFATSMTATAEMLEGRGMTVDQAAIMANLPVWMHIAFAVGVIGGVIGCVLLLTRRAVAVTVLAASLIGYIVLYVGDAVEGVFAVMDTPQVIVLSVVVIVAAALLWVARRAHRAGVLR